MDRFSRVALLGLVATLGSAQSSSSLLGILVEELERNFRVLQEDGDPAPYFIAYDVAEQETSAVRGTLGALEGSSQDLARYLDVTVRVGTPELDNYRRIPGERRSFASLVRIPIEDNPNAIRRTVWLETDRIFRQAASRLIKIRTSTEVRVAREDASGDFSEEEPSSHSEPLTRLKFSRPEWEDRVRQWSEAFRPFPEILTSGVVVFAQRQNKYLATTEGTRLQHGRGFARIVLSAQARAEDGMNLSVSESFEAEHPDGLPSEKVVLAGVERVARSLTALKAAPAAEPFVGPAILSGRATGVFFHEIFGHRVEGHRQKDEAEGQTFTKSVGAPVLPEFLSVWFDPTRREIDAINLYGHYLYDDEGVKARPVPVVQEGILKNFLLSRSPIEGFERSNGHGRKQPGFDVVSRQSTIIVESSRQVSEDRLREMLIEEIRRQDKPYGLYFQQVTGGLTQTGRGGLQAFKVDPVIVYRVYPDGQPDQLVRGVEIVGTPLASFSKILSTSDRSEVFNGYCGAESGSVPVSAVAPAVLVSEIEVQKKETSMDRPPLLPRPAATNGGTE